MTIDPAHVPPVVEPHTEALGRTAARSVELSPIVPGGGGRDDYSGPLLSDVRFDDFSHSALVRIAEEVCLQQHMLTLGFLIGVRKRTDEASASTLLRKQLTGIAGLTSERIRNASGCPELSTDSRKCSVSTPSSRRNSTSGAPSRSTMITSGYVSAVTGASMVDGGWTTFIDADHLAPLDALVRGVDPHFSTRIVEESPDALVVDVIRDETPARESKDVQVTRFSSGAAFVFADRGIPLPLTVL